MPPYRIKPSRSITDVYLKREQSPDASARITLAVIWPGIERALGGRLTLIKERCGLNDIKDKWPMCSLKQAFRTPSRFSKKARAIHFIVYLLQSRGQAGAGRTVRSSASLVAQWLSLPTKVNAKLSVSFNAVLEVP